MATVTQAAVRIAMDTRSPGEDFSTTHPAGEEYSARLIPNIVGTAAMAAMKKRMNTTIFIECVIQI